MDILIVTLAGLLVVGGSFLTFSMIYMVAKWIAEMFK